jgi:hypothetical protein
VPQRVGEVEAVLMDPQDFLIGTAERGDGILVAAHEMAKVIEAMARR